MGFGENNGTFGVVKDEPVSIYPETTQKMQDMTTE